MEIKLLLLLLLLLMLLLQRFWLWRDGRFAHGLWRWRRYRWLLCKGAGGKFKRPTDHLHAARHEGLHLFDAALACL